MADTTIWQKITSEEGGDTWRLPVLGGWLYRTREWTLGGGVAVALAFVPDRRGDVAGDLTQHGPI